MIIRVSHAYLAILIISGHLRILLKNAHAMTNIMIMDQIHYANLVIIHGF